MSQVTGGSALDQGYVGAGGGVDNPFTGGAGNSELDKDAFLKLLITQFQHQDPLNPMDDKEFIAQLAQFSALEQSMAMSEKLDTVVTATNQQTSISVTSYIGKEISGRGFHVSKQEGVISKIMYAPYEEVNSAYVNMLDSSGQIVATIDLGAKAASVHEFEWDGKRTNGSEVPDGVYTAQFSGKNSAGQTVLIDSSITGRVVATSVFNGEHYVRTADGRQVLLSTIHEVVEVKPLEEEEVIPGIIRKGTKGDDYLVGGKGADEILGRGGNDIIVYDPTDKSVDGGKGYDFLIAEGDVGINATNYEAVIRGADAKDIKSMSDLEDMGLVFRADGKEIDVEHADWIANWKDAGKGQWTYNAMGTEKKITIEIQSLITDAEEEKPAPGPGDDLVDPATRSRAAASAPAQGQPQTNRVNFSEELRNGVNNSVKDAAGRIENSLSNNASSVINKFMKTMNG